MSSLPISFVVWLRSIYLPMVAVLAIAYGVFGYLYFSLLTAGQPGKSGVMQASFLIGIPFCMGVVVNVLLRRDPNTGFLHAAGLTGVSLLGFVLAAYLLLNEGMICIIMAIPLFLIFGLLAWVVIRILSYLVPKSWRDGHKSVAFVLLLPFVSGVIEAPAEPPVKTREYARSIVVDTTPDKLWNQIKDSTNIQPGELRDGFAYRIGMPYPIEALTPEPWVGGKRQIRLTRGVKFEEEITAWEPTRHLAWRYLFKPDSFPPGSLDDHIVLGGAYFDIEHTSYTLTPVPSANGGRATRLTLHIRARLSTNFNWYAAWWSDFMIGNTAETLLKFYQQRANPV